MPKKSYRINKRNRLVVKLGEEEIIPSGRFAISPDNNLIFYVQETLENRLRFGLPERINLEGAWCLDDDHNLVFTLKKTKDQRQEILFLKTELLDTRADALIFSLETKEAAARQTIRLMQLKGRWQASAHNRLLFVVRRTTARPETITFQGVWEINDSNSVSYTYKKISLRRSRRLERTLTFNGAWQISQKNRIRYILDISRNSSFDFKVAFETPRILAKKGEIRYRVGIGVRGSRSFREKVFILYGTWNVSRDFGFSFQADYGLGRIARMHFGARARCAGKNEIEFQLTTREGNDIGFSVMVSRRFLSNNAQWFVRLTKRAQEAALESGVTVRF